ncbi:MAG: ImmA/IrrE family metallo-endopeptidase [Acidobacteriales bacterium]|nr:ImmA/IrrE family metallo-endopeptidase [Terriglobales bacterium]
MRRGFKADAEGISAEVRQDLGITATAALPLERACASLGVEVRSAADLIEIDRLAKIEQVQPGAFSACTFEIGDRRIIVWNPLSSPARTSSDITHELSHILLKHRVQNIHIVGELTFFGCDPEEEQEANWLAGCLLLPRQLLLTYVRKGMSAEDIADKFAVSVPMVNYRMRVTGVLQQAKR